MSCHLFIKFGDTDLAPGEVGLLPLVLQRPHVVGEGGGQPLVGQLTVRLVIVPTFLECLAIIMLLRSTLVTFESSLLNP